ncbi:MAG: excinuclease ABC subunit UvrA [Candidatus Delongbacteria bacterium]|nr:excinuclease ABC subunit UvrA [Candidatus Delongbacteria bacterium]
MDNKIKIRGARQHNLKNINIDIPKNKLVCFTGVSGSGKSSLAFDTIYAEGQRRYVESLSTYARQFLGIMEKPDVDLIEGLSPSISIDQKTVSRNPRSTVGTTTEIYDYLRLLFARIGHPHCPICGREISSQSLDEIVASVMDLIKNTLGSQKTFRFIVLSPVVKDKKGEFSGLIENLKTKGIRQVRIDNVIKDTSEDFLLIKTNKHTIDAVIDRISIHANDYKDKIYKGNLKQRLTESIETSLKLSGGNVVISEVFDKGLSLPEYPKEFNDHLYSEMFACPIDNINLPEIEPRSFSFNSPHGACPTCSGIGKILKIDESRLFSYEISITEGAILPFANIFEHDTWYSRLILTVCNEHGIDPKTPLKNLNKEQINLILHGTGKREYKVEGTNRFGRTTHIYETFPGIISELEQRHIDTESDWVRIEIEKFMIEKVCPDCLGARLKKEALGITINKLSISDVTEFSIENAVIWFKELENLKNLPEKEKHIANLILKEIISRLIFLKSVGLGYLTLDRGSGTLSGGESQRIRLASQIGSGLTGVLYVLDEPTIGLHQKDNSMLIDTLKHLRDLGNTVLIVEHDEQTINSSDHIVDFGPGAGKLGGDVVAQGTPKQIAKDSKSLTGQYLSGKKKVNISDKEIKSLRALNLTENTKSLSFYNSQITNHKSIKLIGASQYNLKNIDVEFPLGKFVVITGVSGSGKSTLLVETLYPCLSSILNPRFRGNIGKYKNIDGVENIDKLILIDQSPIGKTPRSNPATYTKVFDPIREVFATTRDSKLYGFKKGRFSFNVKGGRCEACQGQGQIKIEMQFMSDIWVTCEVCNGKRYNAQTLEIDYRGKNIAEVLDLTVSEAREFFHSHNKILSKLETLSEVGLDYMELGQPATTLSGGEAQRVKLATELSKKETHKTLYILDEPTTGLHFADVKKLLQVLKLLVKKGNSVFVIEHNLDVIKNADWIIDLGPDGGDAGGNIVAQGNVSDIIKCKNSYTGAFLAKT